MITRDVWWDIITDSMSVCHNDIISSLKDYDRETAEQRMYAASRSYLSVCISIASLSLCEAS